MRGTWSRPTRVEHAVSTCPDCGAHPRWGIDASAREVIDIPVSAVPVTEHVVIALRCTRPELKRSNAPLPDKLLPDLRTLADRFGSSDGLRNQLCGHLTSEEVDVLLRRTEAVLDEPVFPRLDPRRNVPWPLE